MNAATLCQLLYFHGHYEEDVGGNGQSLRALPLENVSRAHSLVPWFWSKFALAPLCQN